MSIRSVGMKGEERIGLVEPDQWKCEFELFESVEEAIELPRIREGFDSIWQFLDLALRISNRPKARTGRSLERHIKVILDEADKIPVKHLLTLQEGVSASEFQRMTDAGVRLVVPRPKIQKFAKSIRPHLQTLESFIADVRMLSV